MSQSFHVPQMRCAVSSGPMPEADALLVWVSSDQLDDAVAQYGDATGGGLRSAVASGAFAGKACDVAVFPCVRADWSVTHIVCVGAGPTATVDAERVRRVAAVGAHACRKLRAPRVVCVDAAVGPLADSQRLDILAEGIALANFDGGFYKTRDERTPFLTDVTVLTTAPDGDAAVHRGIVVGESANAARVLINEPGNYLWPERLMESAGTLASVPGISIEVLGPARLRDLGMGMLLGVGQGSAHPPHMLVARYEPEGVTSGPVLGLVGKGVTFDTGGISLKPADGMDRMKDDMGGGATVTAALRTLALLKAPVRALAVVPAAENMPGSRALKPGDVLTSAAGLTVEINNTDAEGRLILGDALWYARQLGATHLIDVATLTGACIVALGKVTTGLFGTPLPWVDAVRAAAAHGGEKVWPLPLFDDYKDGLKSDIADLVNSAGRPGGAITAALFLKEFAGSGPWAHLDIAGTVWAEDAKPWMPRGATGAMVRTLVELAHRPLP